jgi:hypothetical protein
MVGCLIIKLYTTYHTSVLVPLCFPSSYNTLVPTLTIALQTATRVRNRLAPVSRSPHVSRHSSH